MKKLFSTMLSLTLCYLCLPISTYAIDETLENASIVLEDSSERAKGSNYNTIIAIHFQGIGEVSSNGAGTRITTNQLHFYNNNPNLIW